MPPFPQGDMSLIHPTDQESTSPKSAQSSREIAASPCVVTSQRIPVVVVFGGPVLIQRHHSAARGRNLSHTHNTLSICMVACNSSRSRCRHTTRARLIEMGKQANQNQRTHRTGRRPLPPGRGPIPPRSEDKATMEGRDGRHKAAGRAGTRRGLRVQVQRRTQGERNAQCTDRTGCQRPTE